MDKGSDWKPNACRYIENAIFKNTSYRIKQVHIQIVLQAYIYSEILQLGICRVAIRHKNNELPCNFSVVPRSGTLLIEMLNCEKLKLLSTNCTMIDESQKKGCINKQFRQEKSHINKD